LELTEIETLDMLFYHTSFVSSYLIGCHIVIGEHQLLYLLLKSYMMLRWALSKH